MEHGIRENKMLYKFAYLPAGLFNRAQVSLHGSQINIQEFYKQYKMTNTIFDMQYYVISVKETWDMAFWWL